MKIGHDKVHGFTATWAPIFLITQENFINHVAYSVEQWSEIANFPVCPVQALEQGLVEKKIQKNDIEKVEVLVENLKIHEQELRVLRQEIERKIRQLKMEIYKTE